MTELLLDALDKLARLARARDRATDSEVRTVTLTDDEALALLDYCEHSDLRNVESLETRVCERSTYACSVRHTDSTSSCETF